MKVCNHNSQPQPIIKWIKPKVYTRDANQKNGNIESCIYILATTLTGWFDIKNGSATIDNGDCI